MIRKWLRNGVLALVLPASGLGVLLAGPAAQARGAPTGVAARFETPAAEGSVGIVTPAALPPAALHTLTLIAQGGPFPYSKDGAVFGNFERRLPRQARGYYHEYTVPTPRARNRGARRIICGGPPRSVDTCYYTGDHYASFKHIVR